MQVCAGACLSLVAPGCILADSSAFMGTEDEAKAEFGDWVAECQAYTTAMQEGVSIGLAAV